MHPDLVIEPVLVQEVAAIGHFIEEVVRASLEASDAEKAAFITNIRANLDQWTRGPAGGLHLKARHAGQVVGVVMVKEHWNLCHLFVEPLHQREGIGRALLCAAVDACRAKAPAQTLRLNAARNAVGFYERMGWQRVADTTPAHGATVFELAPSSEPRRSA
jgi:GNAT superfamily N-acetyltransferase